MSQCIINVVVCLHLVITANDNYNQFTLLLKYKLVFKLFLESIIVNILFDLIKCNPFNATTFVKTNKILNN